MENPRNFQYFEVPADQPGLTPDQRLLFKTLSTAMTYIPIMLAFNGVGILLVYLLGAVGLLDLNETRLLWVAATTIIASILHIPLYPILRKGQLETVAGALMVIDGLASASQVFFWNGIVWFPLLLAISPGVVFSTQRGLRWQFKVFSLLFSVLIGTAILYIDSTLGISRMRMTYLTQMAGLSIYLTVITTMVILVLLNSRINFRSIAGRLTVSFTLVSIIAAITTLLIGSLASFFYNRQKVLQQLDTVANLKVSQIHAVLASLDAQILQPLNDPVINQRINFLLNNPSNNLLYDFNVELVRDYFSNLQKQGEFREMLLLDKEGLPILSTIQGNERSDFSESLFFKEASSLVSYRLEQNLPGSPEVISLMTTVAIEDAGETLGVLVIRSDLSELAIISENPISIGETAETYLATKLGDQIVPYTATRKPVSTLDTYAAQQTFSLDVRSGGERYLNYAGVDVVGYYEWIPEINSTIFAEIEEQEVVNNILNVIITNLVIGLFTVSLAYVIVFLTSQSIGRPIVDLAHNATALASGELSTRMLIDRQDEIGTLASSFNTMASELQTLVRTLEQKVDDRTQDLRKQANYLRVAAEVARDAANARNLDELLTETAELVLSRFGFYHTGVFLIDPQREFAVLRASPTQAGQEMLARNHRLRIGQVGIVGYVAATGEPRVALDTGMDATYFNNPLLPNTRSEIALPLRSNDSIIGVLDVQSEEPEAFTQDDISTLQIMADQLALAIQRVQLVGQLEDNIKEIEKTYQKITLNSWLSISQDTSIVPGYSYDGIRIKRLEEFPIESREALRRGHSVVLPRQDSGANKGTSVAVPLNLREQNIGVLTIRFNSETVSPDVLSLIEETSGRLATALENARLYSETQKLAERERAISEISSRITTSFNIENILRTTVQEIGKILPESEVVVQIQPNKDE